MDKPKIPQPVIDLYDEFTHTDMGRRTFLDRLAGLAGGTAAAAALVPLLQNNYALAAEVAEDDPSLSTETATFDVQGGAQGETMRAYVAKPADAGGPLPAIVVVHENRGLNAYVRDVARRAALQGYVAIAPDFLSSAGGTPDDEDKARDMIGALDPAQTQADAKAVLAYARSGRDDVNGKVGAVGFCWGGGLVNQMAVADPKLDAAVPFYGRQPSAEDAARIKAPLQLHYAGLDERINAGIDAYVAALTANGVAHEVHVYEGVNHAFHNDTNAARYDEKAAKLAWERTMAFMDAHLKG